MTHACRSTTPAFYRAVWRWHFIAGLILGPIILIVSLTGLSYVFKRELEVLLYSNVLAVEESGDTELPLDHLVSVAVQAAGDSWSVRFVEIDPDPERSFGVFLNGPNRSHAKIYVNQYQGVALGSISNSSFFPMVLNLHRRLLMGETGRIITELSACWTVLLVLSGVYLWWPKARNGIPKSLIPRFNGSNRQSLRDLHATLGLWLAPIAVLIAATGLMYSKYWGSGQQAVARAMGSDSSLPPFSTTESANDDSSTTRWQSALSVARKEAPNSRYTLDQSHKSKGAIVIYAASLSGPSLSQTIAVDDGTGDILARNRFSDFDPLTKWSKLSYPLHTGTILGLPSKITWAIVSLGMAMMPVTGTMMWLRRRPKGAIGVPSRVKFASPFKVWLLIGSLCCLLPVAGVSFLLALLVDMSYVRLTAKS